MVSRKGIVGSIGGYVFFENGKPAIRITNIQGAVRASIKKLMPGSNQKELAALTQLLGENWRVYFTKKIAEVAKKIGYPVIGEIPQRAIFLGSMISNYKRAQRQYKQTYRKAGFEPSGENWRFDSPPRIRRKIR